MELSPAVKKRQKMERAIARRLILDGIAAGYSVSVFDGGEFVISKSVKVKDILAVMFSVDEEELYFYKDGKRIGWVKMVYGNDGYDAVCDYTCNLEHIMEGVNALADKLCG